MAKDAPCIHSDRLWESSIEILYELFNYTNKCYTWIALLFYGAAGVQAIKESYISWSPLLLRRLFCRLWTTILVCSRKSCVDMPWPPLLESPPWWISLQWILWSPTFRISFSFPHSWSKLLPGTTNPWIWHQMDPLISECSAGVWSCVRKYFLVGNVCKPVPTVVHGGPLLSTRTWAPSARRYSIFPCS